jgi:hypothetical protein
MALLLMHPIPFHSEKGKYGDDLCQQKYIKSVHKYYKTYMYVFFIFISFHLTCHAVLCKVTVGRSEQKE